MAAQDSTHDPVVTDNADASRFELHAGDALLSYADYTVTRSADATVVVVPHVQTIPEHRGQGNAAKLMDGLLDIIRSDGRRIEPICPFAVDHINNHPEHHDLRAC